MDPHDESLITDDLLACVGQETAPRRAAVTPELVERVLETVEDADPRWRQPVAPPYVLLAFERNVPLPETGAPGSLVTGDEWTLSRPIRTGEELTFTGRLDAASERFGRRFGHTLSLRLAWTFRDAGGDVVAEIGRGVIHYRPPGPAAEGDRGSEMGDGARDLPRGSHDAAGNGASWPAAAGASDESSAGGVTWEEGAALPSEIVTPSIVQVARYCGLTWNFLPIFLDAEGARRAGLPGPIVPGPLKLALMTRYLLRVTGSAGTVRAVRVAHRRPDLVGAPMRLAGVVNLVAPDGGGRTADCEIWSENTAGERSVIGSATLVLPQPAG